jgi:hypothetical protein
MIAEERGVAFDEDKVFDNYQLFGAAAIRLINQPMRIFEVMEQAAGNR